VKSTLTPIQAPLTCLSLGGPHVYRSKRLVVAPGSKREHELRHAALGKTYGSRLLTVVFTIRNEKIRVISARPMSRNERVLYEEET
jgi:uncharacterized protein